VEQTTWTNRGKIRLPTLAAELLSGAAEEGGSNMTIATQGGGTFF
jgi:hypothetical protein